MTELRGWPSISVMFWMGLYASPVALGREPVDTRLERYVAWRAQAVAAHSAYQRWALGVGDREGAFAIYRAELEFEDEAARAYRDWVERAA